MIRSTRPLRVVTAAGGTCQATSARFISTTTAGRRLRQGKPDTADGEVVRGGYRRAAEGFQPAHRLRRPTCAFVYPGEEHQPIVRAGGVVRFAEARAEHTVAVPGFAVRSVEDRGRRGPLVGVAAG